MFSGAQPFYWLGSFKRPTNEMIFGKLLIANYLLKSINKNLIFWIGRIYNTILQLSLNSEVFLMVHFLCTKRDFLLYKLMDFQVLAIKIKCYLDNKIFFPSFPRKTFWIKEGSKKKIIWKKLWSRIKLVWDQNQDT
jgi:hypothetical protein